MSDCFITNDSFVHALVYIPYWQSLLRYPNIELPLSDSTPYRVNFYFHKPPKLPTQLYHRLFLTSLTETSPCECLSIPHCGKKLSFSTTGVFLVVFGRPWHPLYHCLLPESIQSFAHGLKSLHSLFSSYLTGSCAATFLHRQPALPVSFPIPQCSMLNIDNN